MQKSPIESNLHDGGEIGISKPLHGTWHIIGAQRIFVIKWNILFEGIENLIGLFCIVTQEVKFREKINPRTREAFI